MLSLSKHKIGLGNSLFTVNIGIFEHESLGKEK